MMDFYSDCFILFFYLTQYFSHSFTQTFFYQFNKNIYWVHIIYRVLQYLLWISFYKSLDLNSSYSSFPNKPFWSVFFLNFFFSSTSDRIQDLIHAEYVFYHWSIYSVPHFCSIDFFKVNLSFNSLAVKFSHLGYMIEMPASFCESHIAQLCIWQQNTVSSLSLNTAVKGS